jgi:hypothetical protein
MMEPLLEIMKASPDDIGHIFEVDISLHYDVVLDRYLEYGIKMGYKVTKIHSAIRFTQAPFMKSYIEKNTMHRREALKNKEASKVAFFKMANNAVFGKNIENQGLYNH